MKQTAKAIGDLGENIAEKYLKNRFWRIVSRNFKACGGEIDIIAYRFGVLAFVEVKTRTNDLYGKPGDSVDGEKIMHIKSASRQFCQIYNVSRSINLPSLISDYKRKKITKKRIDVIEVYLSKDKKAEKINHIKDWEDQL